MSDIFQIEVSVDTDSYTVNAAEHAVSTFIKNAIHTENVLARELDRFNITMIKCVIVGRKND
jgi:hypothetical protein